MVGGGLVTGNAGTLELIIGGKPAVSGGAGDGATVEGVVATEVRDIGVQLTPKKLKRTKKSKQYLIPISIDQSL